MRSLTVDVDGPVHVADFGGSGPLMVLVHGLGGSHANWLAVAPRLAEHFRVVAPDLAGFGLTEPRGRSSAVTANSHLLGGLLDRLGEPAVVVGNSMGGLVSMMVAARTPRRVQALVLVDPALPRPPSTRPNLVVTAAFAAYAVPGLGEMYVRRRAQRLGPEGLVRQTLELCTVDLDRVPPDVVEAHYALARRRQQFPWAIHAYLEAARSLVVALARRRSVEAMMRAISAPTMLVQGTEDRLVPLAAARLAARQNPAWRFEVYDDIGHTPQLEAPDRFVDSVLDFCGVTRAMPEEAAG